LAVCGARAAAANADGRVSWPKHMVIGNSGRLLPVEPMQYDLIELALREVQGILRANLPPENLPDAQAVQSLRAIVRTPQVRVVLKRGHDTAFCFVLRAVNRILSDHSQPDRTTINRLWDVLDESEFNRALSGQQNMKRPPTR
jgi:hypothetical protein